MDKKGVYSITCGECNSTYIGKTERNINTRISAHKRIFNGGSGYSGIANHLISEKHRFPDEANIKLIRSEHDPLKITIFELLEILKSYKNSPEKFLNRKIKLSESCILKIVAQIKPQYRHLQPKKRDRYKQTVNHNLPKTTCQMPHVNLTFHTLIPVNQL